MSWALSIITDAHGWDYLLTAVFAAFGTVMSIVAWFAKRRMEAYDKHLEECAKRAVSTARAEERLCNVEKETTWVGNCVIAIGTKLGADLPHRPSY
jgi:hypothetical protein